MKIYETEENEDYQKYMTDYPEPIMEQQTECHLDLTNTIMEVDVWNIDVMPNEEYAMLRKDGLGASDSSIVLGVNPYKTIQELIEEKSRDYLTEEEKAVGDESAVKKGLDLEPLIIKKFEKFFGQKNYKPSEMYYIKGFPFIKINFDGVTGTPEQYIPCEIKVCTKKGERHYNIAKAMFIEGIGFRPIQPNHAKTNNSIQTKATLYGIPPYYYTQLQQQIMGLDAPFGYLTVLFETSWKVYTFFVHRDDAVINDIYINDTKVWQRILDRKAGIVSPEIKTRSQILHEDYERTSLRWDNKHKDEKRRKELQ